MIYFRRLIKIISVFTAVETFKITHTEFKINYKNTYKIIIIKFILSLVQKELYNTKN